MPQPKEAKQPASGEVCFEKLEPKVSGLKLNIGSGDRWIDGWINVDLFNKNAQANWDAKQLPLNDCSVAIILCLQTIEHFGYHEIMPILREWHRVLVSGGEVHIVTPDIIESCRFVVENPTNEWMRARIFGNQTHDGQFHKWGFTGQELVNDLGFAGFAQIGAASIDMPSETAHYLYVKGVK